MLNSYKHDAKMTKAKPLPKTIGSKSVDKHVAILINSYRRYFSESLLPLSEDTAEQLWTADFVLVSHGVEDDPVFNFGNLAALALFEMSFAEFTALPSRKSAQPLSRAERSELLAKVSRDGCIDHYTGVRVSATGKRFFIENARVWNLQDEQGAYYGQAAMFRSWSPI